MAGLKQIKTKIRAVNKTRTVTKAMEAVSAAKMRKAQHRALAGRAYARAASAVLARVSGSRDLMSHPLTRGARLSTEQTERQTPRVDGKAWPSGLERRPEGGAARSLYIVITADRGLAGGLNSGVLRAVSRDIAESGLQPDAVSVIAVGRKAQDFFAARGFTIEAYHPNTGDVSTDVIQEIVQEAARRFETGAVDEVKIVYQNFVSTFEQRPTLRTVFPLSLSELSKVVSDIIPAKGAYAAQGAVVESAPNSYSVEPGEVEVLSALLPRLAGIFVYHALLESQASEHSARMVAMKSASDKARDLSHALTLKFNKARQAAITREVSEITGGMEAMAG
jgi:F-type H+-transporting ATPase subunit gamma